MKDITINKTKNNRRYMSGICIDCGCKMNKFLKKEPNKLEELLKEDEVKKDDDLIMARIAKVDHFNYLQQDVLMSAPLLSIPNSMINNVSKFSAFVSLDNDESACRPEVDSHQSKIV